MGRIPRLFLPVFTCLVFSSCLITGDLNHVPGAIKINIAPSQVLLPLNQNQTFSIVGGQPPYTINVFPTIFGMLDSSFTFARPWLSGTAEVRVADVSGNSATALITLPPSILGFSGGGSTATATYRPVPTSSSEILIFGDSDGILTSSGMGGNAFSAKLNSSGGLSTINQFAPHSGGILATATPAGDSYVVTIADALGCGTQIGNHGIADLCVGKTGGDGMPLWFSQIGVAGGGTNAITSISNPTFPSSGGIVIPGIHSANGSVFGGNFYGTVLSVQIAFVLAIDGNGGLRWVTELGPGTGSLINPYQQFLDSAGNVVTCSLQTGTLGGNLYGAGGAKLSVFQLNIVNGTLIWASETGVGSNGTAGNCYGDPSGRVFWSGSTNISLGGAAYGTGHGSVDFVGGAYNPGGTQLWLFQIGGGVGTNTYASMYFGTTGHFVVGTTDGSVGGTQNGTQGATDAFSTKHNLVTGALLWARQLGFGTGANTTVVGSVIDPNENLIYTGQTDGTAAGSQTGIHGSQDVFVARYSSAGALLSVVRVGPGIGQTVAPAVATPSAASTADPIFVDGKGDIFVVGNSTGALPGAFVGEPGNINAFIAKFSGSTGAFLWAVNFGATGAALTPNQLTFDAENNVYLGIQYASGVPSFISRTIGTPGGDGSLLVKMNSSGIIQ